jgi:hypothetical protein
MHWEKTMLSRAMVAAILMMGLPFPGALHAWWQWDVQELRVSPTADTMNKRMAGVNAQVLAASGGDLMSTGVVGSSESAQWLTAYEASGPRIGDAALFRGTA